MLIRSSMMFFTDCILRGEACERLRRNVAEDAKRFAGRQRTDSPARPL